MANFDFSTQGHLQFVLCDLGLIFDASDNLQGL